jgi:hypothetical protein
LTDAKEQAEAHFKKEERGSEAMAEYKAAREAERAKTERLRALRLAKDAAGKKKKWALRLVEWSWCVFDGSSWPW